MFIKENQYETGADESLFSINFFIGLKFSLRLIIVLFIFYLIISYVKSKNSEYTTVNGSSIEIAKNLIKIDSLVVNNIDQLFYENSNCNENNINDFSDTKYCLIISNKTTGIYIYIKDDNIILKDGILKKSLKICTIKEDCDISFIKDNITITKITQ